VVSFWERHGLLFEVLRANIAVQSAEFLIKMH